MTGQEAVALAQPSAGVVAGFLVLAAFVGTGGLVAIFVTARVAHRTLEPAQRVALFRGLGRVYGVDLEGLEKEFVAYCKKR